jgi:LacI family transcriptional regulator
MIDPRAHTVTLTREDKRITIDDVAREADVSSASVSRVISGKGYVSHDVRRRVTEALVRTGYVVNRQARGLAGGRSQVVGLVVRDLDTNYIGEIIRGIDEELASAQYDLMLYTTHRRGHRESAFVATITAGFADGLLLVLPTEPEAYIDSIGRRAFPYVLIDDGGLNDPGPSVGATNEQGGYDATEYLLELGHTRTQLHDFSLDHPGLRGNSQDDNARTRRTRYSDRRWTSRRSTSLRPSSETSTTTIDRSARSSRA